VTSGNRPTPPQAAIGERIIEHNPKGVSSRFYRPGPYTGIEFLSKRFTDGYVRRISSRGNG
jgi:hypothetical protein